MEDTPVTAVLNELLAAEHRNLAPRLFESTIFVSRLGVEAYTAVGSMAQACLDHIAALTELILDLGSQPAPRSGDVASADLHFLEMNYVLPRLIAEQESLVRKYALAAPRVASQPQASALIGRILERHRRDLAQIQSLAGRAKSTQRA